MAPFALRLKSCIFSADAIEVPLALLHFRTQSGHILTITITADGLTETLNFSYNAENETLALFSGKGFCLMFSRLRSEK